MKVRYTVRKQTSGYNGQSRFYVFDTKTNQRATVHPHLLRSQAQLDADSLNISDMVKDYAEDPRPYSVRLAEAEKEFKKESSR